ncbi:hypothetical protein [uncultured Formosa sp.]|uniref:hypothetical protein n=1 Tax=uncultured Formosa sp. TaxID=255435 RepID=UPI00262F6E63|nr:hypothetical protein [uncultured Formosa sp.]
MNVYYLDINRSYTQQQSARELEFWIIHLKNIKKELDLFYSEINQTKHLLIEKAILLQTSKINSILKAIQNYKEFRDWMHNDNLQNSMAFMYEHNKHKNKYLQLTKEYKIFRSKLTQ